MQFLFFVVFLAYAVGHSAAALPQFALTTNGTLLTVDRDDITPLCVLEYNDQLDSQAKAVAAKVDTLIGSELCLNQSAGEILILSVFTTMQFSGNSASLRIVYNIDVSIDNYYEDIEECATDISSYVTNVDNWPDPVIPGSSECDSMELVPGRYDLTGSQWVCPLITDPTEFVDNFLLYQVQVGDVMDTEDGSDLSVDCTSEYGAELAQQTLIMGNTMQDMITDGELCNPQTITAFSPSSALAVIGAQVYYTVTFAMQPGKDVNFATFLDCASDLFDFASNTSNWNDPLLPTQPECPALSSDAEYLTDRGTGWACPDR